MTEQNDSTENASGAPLPVSRRTSVADVFARISITQMTLAVLVVIFLWQWLDGQRSISGMRLELAEKIAEMNGVGKANQRLIEQGQDQMRELSDKVATLETRYAEAQSQRAALEALYNDLSVSRDETALAEVEQMLMIADQQLQLSANVKAALIAMQSADARLQRMDRAAFSGLRKAIIQDMDTLRALPDVDIAGISARIAALIAGVEKLPLVYQQRAAPDAAAQTAALPPETTWQRLVREIWQEARQLVRIENIGRTEVPLLPPEQEFFLRENLKLRLLSAQLALLSRDESSFQQELKTVQAWIARYFDGKSGDVSQMLSALKKLSDSNIRIELPDVSASLHAVRSYRLVQDKAAR